MLAINIHPRKATSEMFDAMLRASDCEAGVVASLLYTEHVHDLFNYGMNAWHDQTLVTNCIVKLFLLINGRPELVQQDGSDRTNVFKMFRRLLIEQLATSRATSTSLIHEKIFSAETQMTQGLTSAQREALFLKFQRKLTYREAASIMNITMEELRSQISKAVDVLLHRNK